MPTRRRSPRRIVAPMFLSIAALLGACDCGKTTPPCEADEAPASCGNACTADTSCGAGTYCDTDGTCTADCTSAGGQCDGDETCDARGRCQPNATLDSGNDATTDPSDGATDAPFIFDNVCADISATPTRVVPTVVLLVDRSGSMNAEFSTGVLRWNAVQTALIGNGSTTGLIEPLEGIVRFGLTTYSAFDADNNGTPEGACPRVEAFPANGISPISPALDNYTPISGAYPPINMLQDETPTGESIEAVVDALVADPNVGRAIIVLATDGEPDSCAVPNPGTNPLREAARQLVYSAVTDAFTNHDIATYVIAVADDGSVSSTHLRQVANLGQGFPQADMTDRFFRPANVPELVTALEGIVGANIPCEVTLNGRVTAAAACQGTVTLNDAPLSCGGANGWTFIDDANDNTIRLNGTACTTWRTDPSANLEAVFPCDAIIIE